MHESSDSDSGSSSDSDDEVARSPSEAEVPVAAIEKEQESTPKGRSSRSASLLSQTSSVLNSIDPSRVLFSPSKKKAASSQRDVDSTASLSEKFARERDKPDSLPKREWRNLPGGGKELVVVAETVNKEQATRRPLFRRKTSKSSIVSAQSID
jgi:hypothetical protein